MTDKEIKITFNLTQEEYDRARTAIFNEGRKAGHGRVRSVGTDAVQAWLRKKAMAAVEELA